MKAWMKDKDEEALKCQERLVAEEEAAQQKCYSILPFTHVQLSAPFDTMLWTDVLGLTAGLLKRKKRRG